MSLSRCRRPRAAACWIRGLLILTCTGVSFAHGVERRAEGHGPHHAHPHRHRADGLRAQPDPAADQVASFITVSKRRRRSSTPRRPATPSRRSAPGRHRLHHATGRSPSGVFPSLAALMRDVAGQVQTYGSIEPGAGSGRRATPATTCISPPKPCALVQGQGVHALRRGEEDAGELQRPARRVDQVHSDLGQGRRRPGARARHDGRLEAHRRHRRREDRQDAPDLRPGRLGRIRRR